jgi:hypothetical protein
MACRVAPLRMRTVRDWLIDLVMKTTHPLLVPYS